MLCCTSPAAIYPYTLCRLSYALLAFRICASSRSHDAAPGCKNGSAFTQVGYHYLDNGWRYVHQLSWR
jgi:hypothetical protein